MPSWGRHLSCWWSMMRYPSFASLLAMFATLAVGCAEAPPGSSGPGVAVRVAPLNLAGVTNASYRITVVNGATQQVAQVDVDADRYGDGASTLPDLA